MKNKQTPRPFQKVKLKASTVYVGVGAILIVIVGLIVFLYLNTGISESAQAAPPTSISGVINSYLRVTAANMTNRRFTCDNLSGNISDFQAGKTVMIYQAQGASITTSNGSSYGTITAYNNAGNYEFAVVSTITGTGPYTITMTALVNSYTASGNIQLISVPKYGDASVTGNVTSVAWSAAQGRGGVVTMEVTGTLTLGANITVSGQGFAGGALAGSYDACPDNSTYTSNSDNFAAKGEGITLGGNPYARGARGTGGGGGNPHNAGGGGGSNYTYGGDGGQGYQPGGACANRNAGGIGGKKISYSTITNKIFFGGGGGAGHQNNSLASAGANGGGIIVIRAKTIQSTCGGTYGFLSKGSSAANTTGNDGAGGGGGGGSIVLDVLNYSLTCNIVADASGGTGGNVTYADAHGGGGGGGMGPIMEVNPTTNPRALFASTVTTNGSDCSGCSTPSGTLPEIPGTSKMAIASVPGNLSTLPIELISFEGTVKGAEVQLTWATASEMNNDFFTIERSADGSTFVVMEEVEAVGNSSEVNEYSTTDKNVTANSVYYYRLKQTDYDGEFTYSRVITVDTHELVQENFFYPNPASDKVTIVNSEDKTITIRIMNSQGVMVKNVEVGPEGADIDVSGLNDGVYLIEKISENNKRVERLSVKH